MFQIEKGAFTDRKEEKLWTFCNLSMNEMFKKSKDDVSVMHCMP